MSSYKQSIALTVMMINIFILNSLAAHAAQDKHIDTKPTFDCIASCRNNNDAISYEESKKCINRCVMEMEDLESSNDSLDIIKHYHGNLQSYRPSYLGVTSHANDAGDEGQLKFQLSFKYQLFQKDWLENIYFGYTQKSIWSVHKLSAPFKENNFAPELFYIYDRTSKDDFLKAIIIGALRHESTGESGNGSRGWNLSYVEPFIKLSDNFLLSLKLWAPMLFLPEDKMFESENKDIFRYYGYGELGLIWSSNEYRLQWRNTFRHGTDVRRYGIESQFDFDPFMWIPKLRENKYFNPTMFVQVWNGYGETLKTYNRTSTDIIIGISAIR